MRFASVIFLFVRAGAFSLAGRGGCRGAVCGMRALAGGRAVARWGCAFFGGKMKNSQRLVVGCEKLEYGCCIVFAADECEELGCE